jgi:O-antigen/teichoic acid export membrane protein
VAILTQPLWPALTDAVSHGDIDWIHRAYRRIRSLLTIYSCVVAFMLVTAGQWAFQIVLHIETQRNRTLFIILGIYLIANIWTHLFYIVMMGMHSIWKVAYVALSENLIMLLLGMLLAPHFGAQGMGLAYLFASILLPVWLLPRMWSGAIEKVSTPQLTAAQTA